jgi:hypothetical protein
VPVTWPFCGNAMVAPAQLTPLRRVPELLARVPEAASIAAVPFPTQSIADFAGVVVEVELVVVPPREFCVVVVEMTVVPPEGSGVTTVVVELLGCGAGAIGAVIVEVMVELPSKFTVVLVGLFCASAIGTLTMAIARTRAHTSSDWATADLIILTSWLCVLRASAQK